MSELYDKIFQEINNEFGCKVKSKYVNICAANCLKIAIESQIYLLKLIIKDRENTNEHFRLRLSVTIGQLELLLI